MWAGMSARRRGGPRSSVATLPWINRWLAACHDLVELERSNPMTDAVIDEIDGRMIRIGDRWLAAFVACPTELKRLLKTAAPPYLYSGPSPVASLRSEERRV